MFGMNYQETLAEIKETIGIVPGFMKALPEEVLVHDWPLWKKYSLGETEIPGKYRELMGLSVAANIKCPYCLAMHTDMAKAHGATSEEIREVYYLASLTSRWSAMLHAQQYDMKQFDKERGQMGEYMSRGKKGSR
jgi:AhpD family alkylhydroperoxidase